MLVFILGILLQMLLTNPAVRSRALASAQACSIQLTECGTAARISVRGLHLL